MYIKTNLTNYLFILYGYKEYLFDCNRNIFMFRHDNVIAEFLYIHSNQRKTLSLNQDSEEMTAALNKMEADAAAASNNVQPLIINVRDSGQFILLVDDKKFSFASAIRAVDVLFKLTMVLNLAYSREAKNFLLFIQRYVFEIKTHYDKMSPSIYDIMSKLN